MGCELLHALSLLWYFVDGLRTYVFRALLGEQCNPSVFEYIWAAFAEIALALEAPLVVGAHPIPNAIDVSRDVCIDGTGMVLRHLVVIQIEELRL